ncbi:MAG TPA: class I SAM-dependent methyltransferase [Herpetosiphonaceae bacterium]|nr:class I SAM-dependent methyltransferase [Herpetosiphonaceae bacterium]
MDAEYDAIAADYDITFKALPYRIFIEEWSVLQTLGDVEGRSILELACGTGHYARRLRQRGASRVVGVDLSPEMIAVAQGQEAQSPQSIEYHVHDVATLDLGEAFDDVVAVYLLHYAADQAQLDGMAQSIARHLKPGGRFVSYQLSPVPLPSNEYYEHYGLSFNLPETFGDGQVFSFKALLGDTWSPPLTVHYWSREALTAALERAGLADVRWDSPTLNPQGRDAPNPEHWQAYLDHPHCLVLSAVKS